MNRGQRVALKVLAAAVAGLGVVVLMYALANPSPPDPSDEAMAALRLVATDAADEALAGVTAALGGEELAWSSTDKCWEGQRNWKVDDGYDHRCAVRLAVAVGFDGDFRERIDRFDRRLAASGWGCSWCDPDDHLSAQVDEYWAYAAEVGRDSFPISRLPRATQYSRGDLRLEVAYGGSDIGGRRAIGRFHEIWSGHVTHEVAEPFDVAAVLEAAKPFRYLVLVAVDAVYSESG